MNSPKHENIRDQNTAPDDLDRIRNFREQLGILNKMTETIDGMKSDIWAKLDALQKNPTTSVSESTE